MECISISPIIAICLLLLALVFHDLLNLLTGTAGAGFDPNYGKEKIKEIHEEIRRKNAKSLLFIVTYPIVMPFFFCTTYSKTSFAIIIFIIAASLWLKSVTCT